MKIELNEDQLEHVAVAKLRTAMQDAKWSIKHCKLPADVKYYKRLRKALKVVLAYYS